MKGLFMFLISILQIYSTIGCPAGWIERSFESNKFCYWLQTATSNLIWRDAFWKCRERGGELFEPTDSMEMRWLEQRLSDQQQRVTGSGVEWHVNAHRSLYSAHPAWRSGRVLNVFGNSVRESDDAAECTYPSPNNSSRRIALPFECGLLRLDSENGEFYLSYTSCIRTRRSTGFVCKLNDNPTHTSAAKPQNQKIGCGSEWITPANIMSEYVLSITKMTGNQNWFDAHQSCRAKGAQLASVESIEDARWIADQIDQRSEAAGIGHNRFFVDLHEWLYRKNGWGSRSGAALETVLLEWADGEPDRKCQQESCAYMSRQHEGEPRLSDTFCSLSQPHMWLVCQRLRSSCSLPIATLTSTADAIAFAKITEATTPATFTKFLREDSSFIFRVLVKWVVLLILACVVASLAVLVLCLFSAVCRVCLRSRHRQPSRPISQEDYYASLKLSPALPRGVNICLNSLSTTEAIQSPPSPPQLPIVGAPSGRAVSTRLLYDTLRSGNHLNPASDVVGHFLTLPHLPLKQNVYVPESSISTPKTAQQVGSQQATGADVDTNESVYLTLLENQKERVGRVVMPMAVFAGPQRHPGAPSVSHNATVNLQNPKQQKADQQILASGN